MNILHVFGFLSRSHGTGTYFLMSDLTKAQSKIGHNVDICCSDFMSDDSIYTDFPASAIYKAHTLGTIAGFHIVDRNFIDARTSQPLDISKYDIIHMHAQRSHINMLISEMAYSKNVPFIIDAHGSTPRNNMGKMLYDVLFGNTINTRCSHFIAEGNFGVREYTGIGIQLYKTTVIQPSLPIHEYENIPYQSYYKHGALSLKDKYGIDKDANIIGYLGRLHKIKGVDLLLDGFIELLKIRPNTVLLLAGADNGLKHALDNKISKHGISNSIRYAGFVTGQQKIEFLSGCDLICQLSRYEQGAYAPLEAILCKTPVLVSNNTGATEDIIAINAGYAVNQYDSKAVATAIHSILNNYNEAMNITLKARHWIKSNLSLDKTVYKYQETYDWAIKS